MRAERPEILAPSDRRGRGPLFPRGGHAFFCASANAALRERSPVFDERRRRPHRPPALAPLVDRLAVVIDRRRLLRERGLERVDVDDAEVAALFALDGAGVNSAPLANQKL